MLKKTQTAGMGILTENIHLEPESEELKELARRYCHRNEADDLLDVLGLVA